MNEEIIWIKSRFTHLQLNGQKVEVPLDIAGYLPEMVGELMVFEGQDGLIAVKLLLDLPLPGNRFQPIRMFLSQQMADTLQEHDRPEVARFHLQTVVAG